MDARDEWVVRNLHDGWMFTAVALAKLTGTLHAAGLLSRAQIDQMLRDIGDAADATMSPDGVDATHQLAAKLRAELLPGGG